MLRLLVAIGLLYWAMIATAPAAAREVVAIRAVTLPDGMRRFSVPLTIGGARVEAGLDSGSTGLRVLPGTLAPEDAGEGRAAPNYSFGSGVELRGVAADAKLGFGQMQGMAKIELVREIACTASRPQCAAARLPIEGYGLQGDGIAGAGFRAILGTGLARQEIPNPFIALGIRRWIIELPRTGETEGRLILDPSESELAGFAMLDPVAAYAGATGGMHDSVSACLVRDADKARLCGAMLMDSGDPGLEILDSGLAGPWPEGSEATLVLLGDGKAVAAEPFVVGLRDHASRMTVNRQARLPTPAIHAGLLPYLGFAVLYDAEHGRIGVKPRPPMPPSPSGILLAP